MLMKIADQPLSPARDQMSDYDRVRRALEYITARWRNQPGLDDVAAHVGLSPSHFHHLFRRFAGITPKAFLQAITLDHAKALLKDSASVLDATYEVGLSGPSRLHDLFVTHEAMSPGEWKAGGEGLTLLYGYAQSPFGEALAVMTDRGLAGLGWVDEKLAPGKAGDSGKAAGGRAGAMADMVRRWPNARFVEKQALADRTIQRIFEPGHWKHNQPLNIVMLGSDFEVRVWQALLKIPMGRATTYGDVAKHIGKPTAARAVGAAVGRNPISFVVPCHRVLGSSGALTGYHWGLTRKQAILGWEAGQVGAA
ncbi:MAG: bifunctional helix-turn-helix domain-containing protein/methylated-DNA--[protein]-cysteine S-methyltransferase [Methylocystis sp.]|nr:bifunctional helix-turn-helix domain-containing protein/methylated-DNA--[protein]-cysteine S-methyltransferase [Methylocystis sp.]MCA3582736.1 bifunctional helix-turn-helix domain-containing protein/methylated-DNA--[protein]-cysteine S-methyltransferase [Methylocystis sp.]MCA3587058.1 bifunctional helix-turn-helix domain-containing protein/methylated-DNA--[protein]-cysteine S-methyltransferase [Methylocystis sp.]MCA3592033.1 bifunctional helix-turn-helix domain-containing protein/methylated-D